MYITRSLDKSETRSCYGMYIIRDFFMYTLTEEVFTENNGEKQKFLSMYINMEMYIISRTSTKYRHKLYFVLKKEFH